MTSKDDKSMACGPQDDTEIPLEPVMSAVKPGEITEELQEGFNVWSLGALVLCLMATWEALATVVASALTNGGPPCLFYN